MMLAGLPVPSDAVQELADLVRAAGVDDPSAVPPQEWWSLADRLERALDDNVKLLALTIDERALMLAAIEDPPYELAELRAVLLATTSGDAPKGSTRGSGRRPPQQAGGVLGGTRRGECSRGGRRKAASLFGARDRTC